GTHRSIDASVAIEWLQGWERVPKHRAEGTHPFFLTGRKSGGRSPYGGILWSRPAEDWESIPGMTQIFGHTTHKEGITQITPQDWCIDTLPYHNQLLLLHNKKLEVITF